MALILHIGYHKTGSTALQSWLSSNRAALALENIVFPAGASEWLGHPEIAWAYDDVNHPWQDRTYSIAEAEEFYRPYLDLSLEKDKLIILSSEEFSRLDFSFDALEKLSNFLIKYEPIIVGYFRDPASFLLSRYRHEVQHGSELRQLREYIQCEKNLQSANFKARTSKWENIFKNRCIFRNYNDVISESDLTESFFNLIDKKESYAKIMKNNKYNYRDEEIKIHPLFIDFIRISNKNNYDPNDVPYDFIFHESDKIKNISMEEYAKLIGVNEDLFEINSFLPLNEINQIRTLKDIENSGLINI